MRRLMLGTLMALAVPSLLQAAPICMSGSLAEYIALGPDGCTVGNALFADFGASVVDPAATPILRRRCHRVSTPERHVPGPGLLADVERRTRRIRGSADSLRIERDGIVVREQHLIDEWVLGDARWCGDRRRGHVWWRHVRGQRSVDAMLRNTHWPAYRVRHRHHSRPDRDTPIFATPFFDVFTEIAVDGGLEGSASLGTVTTEFGFRSGAGYSRADIDAASGLRTGRRAPATQTPLNQTFQKRGRNSAKTHTPVSSSHWPPGLSCRRQA